MLKMEQIYHIKNLKQFEGKSLRKISEITGHDFSTVKKYVEKTDFNLEFKNKKKRRSKLSAYKEIVTKWLINDERAPKKQRHTAKRVYDRLKEMYPEEFTSSDRSVRKFVADIRKTLDIQPDGYIPLEHPSGEAQVDFGEAKFIENGTTYDGYYLSISYPYSNAGYMQLFKSANQECLLEGMKTIFEYVGGTPYAIWFDNMTTAVKKIKEYGKRDLTDGFLRFMLHYGFQSNFCNPNSGHEKGSVENKVGYHRRNFLVPVPEFKDLKEFNRELLEKCKNDMQREHYKGLGKIANLFEEDKLEFLKLPEKQFEVCLYEFAKSDNYGKVKFDGKIYSTSPRMSKQKVMIKAGAHKVEILDENGKVIVEHRRLYGAEKESMQWIPYLELISKRPTALKYTGLFNHLPINLREYLDKCNLENKKQILALFYKMVINSDFETALIVFNECINQGINDKESIWATYLFLTAKNSKEAEMLVPKSVPEIQGYTTNIKIYDKFIPKGDEAI